MLKELYLLTQTRYSWHLPVNQHVFIPSFNFICMRAQLYHLGTICDHNINDCPGNCSATNTKPNGCEDLVQGYRCHCKVGFTGKDCEVGTVCVKRCRVCGWRWRCLTCNCVIITGGFFLKCEQAEMAVDKHSLMSFLWAHYPDGFPDYAWTTLSAHFDLGQGWTRATCFFGRMTKVLYVLLL